MAKAQAAVAKQPTPANYLALGNAYIDQKAYNDAYVALKKAAELAPKDAEIAYKLSEANLYLADADNGIKMAQAAIAINPKQAKYYDLLARHLLLKGKPAEAIPELQKALDLDPRDPSPRLNMVSAHLLNGDKKMALDAARDAVGVAPDNAPAHTVYGELLDQAGRRKEAADQLRTAVRLDDKDARPFLVLSTLLIADPNSLEEARTVAKKAAELDPGDGTAATVAALALYRMGKPTEGLREMDTAVRANPRNFRIWLLMARLLREQGQTDMAKVALQNAYRTAPRVPLTPEQRQKVREEASKAGKTKDGRPVAIDVGKVLGDMPQGNAGTGGPSEAANSTTAGGTP
ncbi:tetratricopeptide repeat protein [bacterium]|nr:tetratricopeptide repeat protein [bacterium]